MSNQDSLLEEVRNRFMQIAAYLEGELDVLYKEGVLTRVDWIKLKEDSKLSAQAVKDALNRTDYPPDMRRTLAKRLIQEYELSAERILDEVRKRRYSTQVIQRKLESIEQQVFPDLVTTCGQFSERQRNEILRALRSKRSNILKSIRTLQVDFARSEELLNSYLEDYRRDLEELAARYRFAIPEVVISRPSVHQEVPQTDAPSGQSTFKFESQPITTPEPRLPSTITRKGIDRSILLGLGFIIIVCLVCVIPAVFFTRIFTAFAFPPLVTTAYTEIPKTIDLTPINIPTKIPTNTPMSTLTNTSMPPTTMPFYKGSLINMPEQMLIKVGKPTTFKMEGTSVDIVLEDFQQIRLQGFGENTIRFFSTRFKLGNPSTRSVVFSIPQLFAAANNSGRRLTQNGSVTLETRGSVTLGPGTQVSLVLNWHTLAYTVLQSRSDTQRIFVVVNAPISDDLNVTLDENSAVFVLEFQAP